MSLAKGKQNKYKYQQTEIIIHRPRKKQITKLVIKKSALAAMLNVLV